MNLLHFKTFFFTIFVFLLVFLILKESVVNVELNTQEIYICKIHVKNILMYVGIYKKRTQQNTQFDWKTTILFFWWQRQTFNKKENTISGIWCRRKRFM